MDKTKRPPIPDKTKEGKTERKTDPQFIRGTIDPPTKKER